MAHPRRFRFGVQLHATAAGEQWRGLARRAEHLGYESLSVPDHFGDQLGPVASLMAAADATTRLRVGSLVLGNDFRHPAVTAKEMASLDVLSGGRAEFGLGAGWMTTDYDQTGMPRDEPGVRVERLAEAVTVVKGLFGDGPLDFDGAHYRISGLDGLPKPIQRPFPLLIGGGSRRVLHLAGREAAIVGVNPSLRSGAVDAETVSDATASSVDRKLGWLREGAGARFDDLELTMLVFGVTVTDDRAAALAAIAPAFGVDPGEAAAIDTPYLWVGSVEAICADLRAWRERWGVSYWVVQGAEAMEAAAPVVAHLAGT